MGPRNSYDLYFSLHVLDLDFFLFYIQKVYVFIASSPIVNGEEFWCTRMRFACSYHVGVAICNEGVLQIVMDKVTVSH